MSVDPVDWITPAAATPLAQQQAAAAAGSKRTLAQQAASGEAHGCQPATDREGDGPFPYRPHPDETAAGRTPHSRDATGTRGTQIDLTG